jgi:hypothetical protein
VLSDSNKWLIILKGNPFFLFFGVLEFVDHSFAYIDHFVFLRVVWIRAQKDTVASGCASTNLATHLPPFLAGLRIRIRINDQK